MHTWTFEVDANKIRLAELAILKGVDLSLPKCQWGTSP